MAAVMGRSNFNPRSPCGERLIPTSIANNIIKFQSTLPVRGATNANDADIIKRLFQSTLPVRGATPAPRPTRARSAISIHAPRAGSDECRRSTLDLRRNFNPRSPCGERPVQRFGRGLDFHFNPRSPCGERRSGRSMTLRRMLFQSTLPVRGATRIVENRRAPATISIHAPRAGSDRRAVPTRGRRMHFNPRSPCGERPGFRALPPTDSDFNPRSPCGERRIIPAQALPLKKFQSTLPVRGATAKKATQGFPSVISIHAPRAGSDLIILPLIAMSMNFNPRSPCGERHVYGL